MDGKVLHQIEPGMQVSRVVSGNLSPTMSLHEAKPLAQPVAERLKSLRTLQASLMLAARPETDDSRVIQRVGENQGAPDQGLELQKARKSWKLAATALSDDEESHSLATSALQTALGDSSPWLHAARSQKHGAAAGGGP